MTLVALNGTECAPNGDILIAQPTPLAFLCAYEATGRQTMFRWSMDGTRLTELTTRNVAIAIPSGSHVVTCEANIDASDNGDINCTCVETATLNVTVVGT